MTWCIMCGQLSRKLHKSVQIKKTINPENGAEINYPCFSADTVLRLAQQLHRIVTLSVNSYGDSFKKEVYYIIYNNNIFVKWEKNITNL